MRNFHKHDLTTALLRLFLIWHTQLFSVMQQCWLYRIFTFRFCYCDEKIVVLQEGTQYLHAAPAAVEETASLDGVSWDYYLETVCDALPPKVFFKFIWLCILIFFYFVNWNYLRLCFVPKLLLVTQCNRLWNSSMLIAIWKTLLMDWKHFHVDIFQ